MSLLKDMIAEAGSGAPSAFNKDTPIGTTVSGKVVAVAVRQATDITSGEKKFWDDGNPMQKVIVTVQTGNPDPHNPEDDGTRSVYINWWTHGRTALVDALTAAGADDVEVGGTFAAQYTGEGVAKNKGVSPPKLYKYEYRKPAGLGGLLGAPEPAAPPAAPAYNEGGILPGPAGPVAAAAAPPTQVDPSTIATVKALLTGGATDDVIRVAFPQVSAELLAALRNAA